MKNNQNIKTAIIAHLEGNLKGEEMERLHQWLAKSRQNQRYYARIKDIWESSVSNPSHQAETEKEWSRFISRVTENYQANIFRFKTNFQIFFRLAAVLVMGMVIGALILKYVPEEESMEMAAISPRGSVSQVVLADSTIVFLNAGSEIRYNPAPGQNVREIFLSGEAWFDVAKQERKPFIVHTSTYRVQVTGTRFNVKSYKEDNEVITTLEEGEVRIISSEHSRLAETIVMQPGEQVAFNKKSNKITLREVNPSLYSSWKDNKLIFLNMNLAELIVLLERKYGVDIEVDNPGILKYHYTGTIKNETILEILEIIKHTLPIEYVIEGQTVHIRNLQRKEAGK